MTAPCYLQDLPNAERVPADDPGMRFAVEQIEIMRKPDSDNSMFREAPHPVHYSTGDRADFATNGVQVIYWDPVQQLPHLDLQDCVRCICCGRKAHKDGVSKPRRVFGLKGCKLVAARKYRCSKCPASECKDVTYDAKHPKVMERLPASAASLLPVTFTHSGAMDNDMLLHIHLDIMKGVSIQASCDRALAFLRDSHNQTELAYMDYWAYRQKPGLQTRLDLPATSGAPPEFGQFGSASFHKPYLSSSQWCAGVWLAAHRTTASFANRYTASRLGQYLCLDHTFRLAKYIRNADGTQAYLALLSVKNEYGEVVAYWFTHTTSLLEVEEGLTKLQKRYEAAGLPVCLSQTMLEKLNTAAGVPVFTEQPKLVEVVHCQ